MALLSLIAKLGLDKTGFDAGMDAAAGKVNRFGSALKVQLAAAFSAAAIVAYTKHLIEFGSALSDINSALGVSFKDLQSFAFALGQTGGDLDALKKGLKELSKAQLEAISDPKSKAAQVFEALEISGEKLKNMDLATMFRAVAAAFKQFDFGASEAAMATELFGRNGETMLALFNEGLAGLEHKFKSLNATLSDETVRALDDIGDSMAALKAKATAVFAPMIADLLKIIALAAQLKEAPPEENKRGGLAKTGHLAAGVALGGLGLWDQLGAKLGFISQEKADERVRQAEEQFQKSFGWVGSGIVSKMAAAKNAAGPGAGLMDILKAGQKGPPLDFEEKSMKMFGLVMKMFGLAPMGGGPIKKDFAFAAPTQEDHIKNAKKGEIFSNKLNRIGAFTGSSPDVISGELKRQGATLKEIKRLLDTHGIKVREL